MGIGRGMGIAQRVLKYRVAICASRAYNLSSRTFQSIHSPCDGAGLKPRKTRTVSLIRISSRQAVLLAATFSLSALALPAFAQSSSGSVAPPVTQGSVKQLRGKIAVIQKDAAERQKKQDTAYALAVEAAKKAKQPVPPKSERIKAKTGYLEAYLDYVEQRAFPNDTIDLKTIYQASEDRDAMEPFRGIAQRFAVRKEKVSRSEIIVSRVPQPPTTWQFIGPRNLTTPYQTYYGPASSATSGRINGVAYHPTDSNIAYLASGGGGAWKTTDGGVNWVSVDKGFLSQNTGCVAIDPANGNTVYIGMGDFNGGIGNGGGVMKSIDGGANWTRLDSANSTFISSRISALAIDPDNTNRLLAATSNSRIFLSINGGTTWTQADSGGRYSDLEISPVKTPVTDSTFPDTRLIYATNEDGYVRRSTGGGAAGTWTSINLPTASLGYVEVATSPTDGNVLYLSVSGTQLTYKGIRDPNIDTYTWEAISSTGFPNGTASNVTYNWSQVGYDHHFSAVAQKTSNAAPMSDFLYSSLITLAGKKGENNWQDIGITFTGGARTHNDQHAFAAFPGDPNKMLFGNDGGVYGLTYSPTTGAYTINDRLSATLGVTMFYYADFHPTNPLWAVGGTQDNATPVMRGDSANWRNEGGGDGGGSAINPLDPNRQYGTVQNGGFYYTSNGWTYSGYSQLPRVTHLGDTNFNDGAFTARLSIDPNYPNPVYYGGKRYLHRFNVADRGNGGAWETKLGNYDFGAQVRAITVAPSDSRMIFAGTSGGRLARSTDYGATWTVINGSLPNLARKDIWVNPANPADVIVVLSGTGSPHVYRSANALAASPTWTNISGVGAGTLPDVPVNSITHDPFDKTGNTFFIGADNGVYATDNGGTTWTNATAPLGLPNTQVSTVKAMEGTGYLMAATYGRGMYRIALTPSIPNLKPDLRITQTQSRGGTIRFVVTLNNIGGTAANALNIATASLRVGTATIPATAISAATSSSVIPGSSSSVTIDFPVSAGAAGTSAQMGIKGTYTFGANTGSFGSAAAIKLP